MLAQRESGPDDLMDQLSNLVDTEIAAGHGMLEQLSRRLLAAIRRHLGMDVAFISEFVGDRRVFRYVNATSEAQWLHEGDSDPREETYCQRVIDGRLPQLIRDATKLQAARDLEVTWTLPVGAHISVPIQLTDGSIFGTFCAFQNEADLSLNERNLALVRVFADVAAALIESNRDAISRDDDTQSRLQQRLAHGEPVAVCQPIVDLASRETLGFEMLSRFPGEPPQPPDRMFTDAANVGLEGLLTQRSVDRVVEALPLLPADTFISLNLSPATVFGGDIERLLSRLPPERLVVEITEHAIVHDYGAIADALAPLREQGARLAVDDAGAGYASFRHILHLDPDIIKLDMSLIRDVETNLPKQALAVGLTEFGRRGGYQLVAEGIETEAELAMLRTFGPMMGQGYLFASPQRPEAFAPPIRADA